MLAVAPPAYAANKFWGDFFGGTFSDPTNWQGNMLAGPDDIAHFGLTVNPLLAQRIYAVDLIANVTNQALKIEDDFVTFDLQGKQYTTTLLTGNEIGNVAGRSGRLTITNGFFFVPVGSDLAIGTVGGSSGILTVSTGAQVSGSPFLLVGGFGSGTLAVSGGGFMQAGDIQIGNSSTSPTSTATVSGPGSVLFSGQLNVGNQGPGALNITAEGQVGSNEGVVGSLVGSTGTVNVDGANSLWNNMGELRIGERGRGTLNITAGGRVESTRAIIGDENNSIGEVSVSGAGSEWINSGNLFVGNSGPGTLDVTAGGRVQNNVGIVSAGDAIFGAASGTVNVDGANSQWINSGELTVGLFGEGTLNITGGGLVQNTDGVVGSGEGFFGASGRGTVNVEGANSMWLNSGELTVGDIGQGILHITNGGRVQNMNIQSNIGVDGGSGTVTVDGANSQFNSTILNVGVALGTGTLNINQGSAVNVNLLQIGNSGTVRLNGGTLDAVRIVFEFGVGGQFQWTSGTLHVGEFCGNLVTPSGGTLAPGHSAGETFINGNYTQLSDGVMEIELGGAAPGTQHDFINVDFVALVGGELHLKLIDGFVPGPDETFLIVDAGSISGAFDNVANGQRLTTFDGLGSFVVNYGPGSPFDSNRIVLSAFEAVFLPGDYNQSGTVDAADYVVWRENVGTNNMLPNDAVGGTIGQAHYDQWRAHFGESVGIGAGEAANSAGSAVPEPVTAMLLLFAAAGGLKRRRTYPRISTLVCRARHANKPPFLEPIVHLYSMRRGPKSTRWPTSTHGCEISMTQPRDVCSHH
jgi:T5SS/PEP-CTERM-associated repeat protein